LDLSDGGKHVRTRDGREVRIFMTDGGSRQPVIGAVLNGTVWCPHRWSPDGSFYCPAHTHSCDLIPYTPTEQWLIDVPAGQTPVCFVPTGEVRQPKAGELFRVPQLKPTNIALASWDHTGCPCFEIVTPVTPRRAP
jgi:hypothetical protein